MTDKQFEWRDAIAIGYLAAAVLAYVMAFVLAFDQGAMDTTSFWKLMYVGSFCLYICLRQQSAQALELVRRSNRGWAESNELLARTVRVLTQSEHDLARLREELESLKRHDT